MTTVGNVVPGCYFEIQLEGFKGVRIKTDWIPGTDSKVNSIGFPGWKPIFTDPALPCKVLGKVSNEVMPIN